MASAGVLFTMLGSHIVFMLCALTDPSMMTDWGASLLNEDVAFLCKGTSPLQTLICKQLILFPQRLCSR